MYSSNVTPDQHTLLPTEADIAFFDTNGYYVPREKFIPDWLIEKGILGSQRFYRGERDARLPVESGFCNTLPIDDKTPRNNEFVSLQINELKELAQFPLLGAIAAKLT